MENAYLPQSVPHPGEILREKLDELEMGPKEFALRTGKPEKTISAVLKGHSAITLDMALKFEMVTRIPAHFWMNFQRGFDEYIAREKQRKVIEEARDWTLSFPIIQMCKLGWLPQLQTTDEYVAEMLAFFGFAEHRVWEDYYFRQQLKVAFRISLANINKPFAISAWLRKGELQASELHAKTYSEKLFKNELDKIVQIGNLGPKDFFDQLQNICLDAGVKVVHTPCLPEAPIAGATRWLHDTPLIQLSDCDLPDNNFWFTFFHEAGHILLHGKKDIFLEKIAYSEKDTDKEKEADDFASTWLGQNI